MSPWDWDELAEAALARLRAAGADYGDVRFLTGTTQVVRGEDRRIAAIRDGVDSGFGVRVLYRGAWGFAASAIISPEEVPRVADLAVELARGAAALAHERVRLAPEPVHRDTVVTPRRLDPFAVPLDEKTGLLLDLMEYVQRQPGVVRSAASLWARRDLKRFVSTEGTRLDFDLLAVHGEFEATAVRDGRVAVRRCSLPPLRRGYELIEEANLPAEAPRVAAQAVEKAMAPPVEPGRYDLILDPEHLCLTIHETCGHASELDRALGYEANDAGTTFLTPEKLGAFRYGSPHVTLIADDTEPETLAATGYDDEGVACQRWDIVREGLFVGYSTSREVAPRIGEGRSRGSCRADGWAHAPIVRIANVGLAPGRGSLDDLLAGVERGLYIEGQGSFSIDPRRENFLFGGDACWLIERGRRTHMVRDVIYQGHTPAFWGSCDGVAGPQTRQRHGLLTCGKGQPGQSGWTTHAASPARFRGVTVLRGAAG